MHGNMKKFEGKRGHLHGQTGRLTVWANGTQNSGLANFVPESRLPFVQISSIYQKTTAKAWTRYQRWNWNIPSGKKGLPSQIWASIKPGTGNIPEHSGTSRNIPKHEKIKIIFMKIKKINNNNNNKIIFIKINNNVK